MMAKAPTPNESFARYCDRLAAERFRSTADRAVAAHRNARIVIEATHGPRPVAKPAYPKPILDPVERSEEYGPRFLAYFDAIDAQRAWDRRVRALTNAILDEVRCIQDRAVVRPMADRPRRARAVSDIALHGAEVGRS